MCIDPPTTRTLRRAFQVFQTLAWHLAPGRCLGCGLASDRRRDLCWPCQRSITTYTDRCWSCALPLRPNFLTNAESEPVCGRCLAQPPAWHRCVCGTSFEGLPAIWLQGVKWRNQLSAARVLGYLAATHIAEAYGDDSLPDLLVPVPLSRRRLARRGYNQSAVLATWIGRELSIPISTSILRRARHTVAQTTLSRRQRLLNVRGAFAADVKLDGARVAVVDDVMTTGATLSQAARVLTRAGASEIHLWPVARRQ